jgi:hypothetical protein
MLALAALWLAGAGAQAQATFAGQPVGAVSGEQNVTVTSPSGGTVSSVDVLTLGAPNLDFKAGIGVSCISPTPLAANGTCQQSVTFTPAAPGLRFGAVVLLDAGGAVLGTTYISGTGLGGLGVLVPGNVLPVAGQDGYFTGSLGDGLPATSAELYLPTSVVLDGAGNMYIADSNHNRIRMVCASAIAATSATIKGTYANCTGKGIIVTIAGNGNGSYTGDNGPASASTLSTPSGVALDGAGNLYIADTGNNVIRMIDATTGIIATIAGNGTPCAGKTDSVGDGCAANQAVLNQPLGVTLDSSGNLYIADTNNQRIRKVAVLNGTVTASSIITSVAGNGALNPNGGGSGTYSGDNGPAIAAGLNSPYTVAFDAAGNLYIPDSSNNRVRMVAAVGGAITPSSVITTFAGDANQGYTGDGGAATQADLWAPSGVAVDAAGNVFIADTQNAAVRKVSSTSSATPGIITTLIRNGTSNFYFKSVFARIHIYGPTGLYLDGMGNLYVADSLNQVIRDIQGNFVAVDLLTTPVRQGSQSAPTSQTVENDGNAAFDLTAITALTNAATNDAGITDPCAVGNLAVAADCAVGAVFAPTVAGNPVIGNIDLGQLGDTVNSPLDIELIGDATAVNSTTVLVNSNNNPSGFGQSVTLTATVQTGAGTGNLTGTVTFFNGSTPIASNVAMSTTTTSGTTESATATFTTTTLPVGANSITATYNVTGTPGDPAHSTSTSPVYTQNVLEATTTFLATSQSPSTVGQNVTFTATVSISGGGGVTPDGTVTFFDGVNALGSVALIQNGLTGVATFSTTTLTQGIHAIQAVYGGGTVTPQIKGSDSNTVTQDVQATSSVVLTSSLPTSSNYGQAVTFTATVTPTGTVAATGTVKFYFGATLIGTGSLMGTTNQAALVYSALPVGNDPITAQYVGDANNGPSNSQPITQVVNQTQTSTTVTAAPTPGIAGGPIAITATVSVIAGSATTTGMVTFTSGTTTLGSANLNTTTGKATINPLNLAPGPYSIVATYAGDSNDQGSQSAVFPYNVVQATTQTAVTVSPNPALVGATVTFTAKVKSVNGGVPTGSVIFSASGVQIGAAATLDGTGTASLPYSGLAAGSYTITAVYSGDPNDLTSNGTATASLVVGTIPTNTDLGSSTTSGPNPQVILVATVLAAGGPIPTGTVTFTSGANTLGTTVLDASGVATLIPNLTAGTNYTITASYSGNNIDSPSTSQPITLSGTANGFSLTVTPATVSMASSQNATVNVTLVSNGGFADSIGLGCASVPTGVFCHFAPLSVPLAANATATAQLTIDTNNPLSGGSTATNTHTGIRATSLAGLVAPFSLLFGWFFWRFRKRHATLLTMALALILSGASLLVTGCGGISLSKAPAGTYVIQVTGVGANTNVIHYQNVTLTIK